MIGLEAPFIPDDAYIEFLQSHVSGIESVYFSLFSEAAADSRHRFQSLSSEELRSRLARLNGPKKYALLNSRFHLPQEHFRPDSLKSVVERLRILNDSENLNGIVFADPYYLKALSDADPSLARRLEAVPSVNCMADTFEKVVGTLDGVAAAGFAFPGKYVLDRSLNRKPTALADIARRCRRAYPAMKIGLLVNEGCLYQCSFKAAHDAQISLVHMKVHLDTFAVNRDLGCMRALRENPHLLLKSPFIRPEDVDAYADVADFIKLSGRTLGAGFLRRAVTAYTRREYHGNLLDLMDSMEWFAAEYDIPNRELPDDFLERMISCDKNCGECADCRDLFRAHAKKKEPRLKDLR